MELANLNKVSIREIWKNEASDFTQWLAQPENIALLSDEIGIDVKLVKTEADVGRFSVDILAEEENTGRKIIIENQLESTDHGHLGQIITYASGYDAEIIIWVVKEVKDEHKQAIDWLNEHTDEGVNFFIIQIEVWQIADSPCAPKFQIISQPNDWAKAMKKSASEVGLTDTKIMQLDFWNKFRAFAEEKGTSLRLRKTRPQHWYDIRIGSSDMHISLTINTQADQLGCEIYIPDSKELYSNLLANKEKIEEELGEKITWMELQSKKASRLKLSKDVDLEDIDRWTEYFDWLKCKAERFKDVFGKYK